MIRSFDLTAFDIERVQAASDNRVESLTRLPVINPKTIHKSFNNDESSVQQSVDSNNSTTRDKPLSHAQPCLASPPEPIHRHTL